ncbi:MAG: hypothetical protein HUU60_10185 [Armatimonadetes bacterium]|nr:hypothetical protein [Armatimonadota bacterium]
MIRFVAVCFLVLVFGLALSQGSSRLFVDLSGPFDAPPPLAIETDHHPTAPVTALVAQPGQYVRVTMGIELDYRNTDLSLIIGNFFFDFADNNPANESHLDIHRYHQTDPR